MIHHIQNAILYIDSIEIFGMRGGSILMLSGAVLFCALMSGASWLYKRGR